MRRLFCKLFSLLTSLCAGMILGTLLDRWIDFLQRPESYAVHSAPWWVLCLPLLLTELALLVIFLCVRILLGRGGKDSPKPREKKEFPQEDYEPVDYKSDDEEE